MLARIVEPTSTLDMHRVLHDLVLHVIDNGEVIPDQIVQLARRKNAAPVDPAASSCNAANAQSGRKDFTGINEMEH